MALDARFLCSGVSRRLKQALFYSKLIFYSKTGLRFALAGHISENFSYSNSYTGKFQTSGKSVLRGKFGHNKS